MYKNFIEYIKIIMHFHNKSDTLHSTLSGKIVLVVPSSSTSLPMTIMISTSLLHDTIDHIPYISTPSFVFVFLKLFPSWIQIEQMNNSKNEGDLIQNEMLPPPLSFYL